MTESDQAKELRKQLEEKRMNEELESEEIVHPEAAIDDSLPTPLPKRKITHSKTAKKKRKRQKKLEEKKEKRKKKANWWLWLARLILVLFLLVPVGVWYIVSKDSDKKEEPESTYYEKVKIPINKSEQEEIKKDEQISSEEETEQVEEKKKTPMKLIFHTVVEGDTLDSLAIEYYGSSEQKTAIIDYNRLKSEELEVGSSISIPILINEKTK